MEWLQSLWAGLKNLIELVIFLVALVFPKPGSLDSAARDMNAQMAQFERIRVVLVDDPQIAWVQPSDDLSEIYTNTFSPHPPITAGRRARYGEIATFLRKNGYRDVAPVRRDGKLTMFRLVLVEPAYFGRQKLVTGVWVGDGSPMAYMRWGGRCRAVRAPHWYVCEDN